MNNDQQKFFGAKLLSDLVIFSILSSDITLDFHDLDFSSTMKIFNVISSRYKHTIILKYSVGINAK